METSTLEPLGDLLRLRLDDDQPHEITLERELQWTENYLAIERECFGSRLEVRTSVRVNVRRALVPAMLLQPLVENAVRHGIATADGRGQVGVEARRAGDELVVTVTDSGAGFGQAASAGGIGLSNTRQRLEQLHGAGARLQVGDGTGGGAFTVRIPWRTESGDGTA